MSDLPKFIEFHEEGPREGFQIEPPGFSIGDRARVVDALSETGVGSIQVASFVNPKRVPQMADAEELFAAIRRKPGISYTGLWLNDQGFRRAQATPGVDLKGSLPGYASEEFCQHNNGCSRDELRQRLSKRLEHYEVVGLPVSRVTVMVAFGCNFAGEVATVEVIEQFRWALELLAERGHPVPPLYLADTVGWATPLELKRRVGALRELTPAARIGLHLHDTRGAGAANFVAGLEMGVELFDSSVAGLGGCPFAGSGSRTAAGNICTEDMVFLAHEMGLETGIDLDAMIEASLIAEDVIGRPLNGRIMHSGSLRQYRNQA